MFEIQNSNDWSTPSSRLSSTSPNYLAIADVAVSARRGRIGGDGILDTVTDGANLGGFSAIAAELCYTIGIRSPMASVPGLGGTLA